MVAGPEICRFVSKYEFEAMSQNINKRPSTKHHEQTARSQKVFLEKVDKLCTTLADMRNPFEENSPDLLSLDTLQTRQRQSWYPHTMQGEKNSLHRS